MFYVVDLSAPRKYIQAKFDDIMFDLRLNPPKINKKVLIVGGIVLICIIASSRVAYAGVNESSAEYKYLINHYVNNLNYPKEKIIYILGQYKEQQIQELYIKAKAHNEAMSNTDFYLIAGRKVVNIVLKPIRYLISIK